MFSSARWEYQSRDNGTSSITENPHRQHGPHPPHRLRHAHHADGYERDIQPRAGWPGGTVRDRGADIRVYYLTGTGCGRIAIA